jgi:hypothetical protein
MARLAVKDEPAFIKLVQQNQITDFTKYVGYNYAADDFLMLESGRRLLDTTSWNPLTYALVFDRPLLLECLI